MTTPDHQPSTVLAALEARMEVNQIIHARRTLKAVRDIVDIPLIPRPTTDNPSADYYLHIARCEQCRDHDMTLCREGYNLLCRMAQ